MIYVGIEGTLRTGKTTVMHGLLDRGQLVTPEAALFLIDRAEEDIRYRDCVPWRDFQGFQDAVARKQLEYEEPFRQGNLQGVVFFDRSLISGIGYCNEKGVPIPEILHDVPLDSMYDLIFILDLLPNYKPDNKRRETPEQRKRIHNHIVEAYRQNGYNPYIVPVMTPEERVDYILRKVSEFKVLNTLNYEESALLAR